MTAAKSFDMLSPFTMKREKDENPDDDDDDDDDDDENNDDDAISVSSLAQPSILDKDNYALADTSNEFLRLNSMVRRVYFSYLHKSVISNYNVCCQSKEKEISKSELKRFAGQMELCAVKASLEASLYRQTMLKMISDIKANTSRSKMHKKLTTFLETPLTKVDIAVQTSDDYPLKPPTADSSCAAKDVHIQSAFVTSNFDENSLCDTKKDHMKLDDRIAAALKVETRLSPQSESTETKNPIDKPEKTKKIERITLARHKNIDAAKRETGSKKVEVSPFNTNKPVASVTQRDDKKIDREMRNVFGENEMNPNATQNDDDDSQDSLMQHLEDMFCESDDSSDLMTLIEKHSGVSKANVDTEIGKMCPVEPSLPRPNEKHQPQRKSTAAKREADESIGNSSENSSTKRKLSFSNYKKMKKRAMGEPETPPAEETPEDRQARRARGIWFVERVHQVSKLRTKMMELSVRNYRKHGRLRVKFMELFGDSDEEEMMPDSPIHIEEHLTACKERIAPWVVQHLMPFYSKRIISNRLLFKAVAKHIADMLIIENTFPEENDVGAYIKQYFRNKISIKSDSDIYI